MAGIPSAVIRFACHIPLWIVGLTNLGNWRDIKKHEILSHPPYNQYIFPAWHLAGGMGVFALSWNLAMWIPTAASSGAFLFCIGLVDFVIAVCLTVAAALQGTYIPHKKSSCSEFISSHPPNSTTPSLFTVIASDNSTFPDWRHVCTSFVETWSCQIAVCILYFISAFLSMVLGCWTANGRSYNGHHRRSNSSSYSGTIGATSRTRSFCKKFIFYIICWPPYLVLWKGPIWSILKMRYFRRFTMKFWHGSRHRSPKTELSVFSEKQKPQPSSVDKFVGLLHEDRIQEGIAAKLHFVDLVNLSSTCKSVRQALVSPSKNVDSHENLRILSCTEGRVATSQLMAFFARRLKNKQVRTLSQSSLNSAVSLPSSGLTFVDNCQGASAAVSELSGVLDDAIEQLDLHGNLRDGLKSHLESLDQEASKYANCGVPRHARFDPWNPTFQESELVYVSWKCSASVYETERRPHFSNESLIFDELKFIRPSITGTTKAASFTSVRPVDSDARTNPMLPALIVAIRGTENLVAHMVNLNGQPKMFHLPTIRDGTSIIESMQAHGGFLNGAEALLPEVIGELGRLHESEPTIFPHVVFTGHSAGGAIASLLYLKIFSDAHRIYPNFQLSCITFGSPPIINPRPMMPQQQNRNGVMVLSIVNEYDLVTRSDTSYIRSLASLFRSIYRQPPILEAKDPDSLTNSALVTETESNLPSFPFTQARNIAENEWALPLPEYHHVGDIVLLTKDLVMSNDQLTNALHRGATEIALKALRVPHEEFGRMLFCRIGVHRRKEYDSRVEQILAGRFNRRSGW
ncbi:uncharacterized protein Z518_10810 [Rhinocladiella mackenziei CBS 650.93]|uniref:Fungal lipase-type domain-containing protein n=1 Tax=Rhinocladiella mackenziei CBS 650.93 TaxID=1442369 RepID=A0A0D2GNC6_9EURO|nr:uncharacterized protein Z518_10810 [Rhinocladiella mackenziei CBS 650.93]KIW99882.1 hypothetical protein Z518_10810 [Rhinocladiella mackenziei CBS 650.93]